MEMKTNNKYTKQNLNAYITQLHFSTKFQTAM